MEAPVVLVSTGSADVGLLNDRVPELDSRLVADLRDVDATSAARAVAVVLRSGVPLGAAELSRLPRLRLVLRAGSGVDNIDLAALRHRGVELRRNPEAGAAAVAEWVLLALLALARRAALGHNALRAGRHLKPECVGVSSRTLQVGVWGAGPVGRAAAATLAPHALDVCFAEWPSVPAHLPSRPGDALLGWADVHVLALPLRRTTASLVDAAWLRAAAPRRPLLICAGRLGTLDLPAVFDALRRADLSGLALDPLDPPDLPLLDATLGASLNLLATPHIGAQRADVRDAIDEWVAEQLASAADAMFREARA